ncbi:hypothetical protein SNEBB_010279 [Seison nebaliae]|nr:hypothetical protein SNEBB_010279 [Seison nebaliae]
MNGPQRNEMKNEVQFSDDDRDDDEEEEEKEEDEENTSFIRVGVCAMEKKSSSKPMRSILDRLLNFPFIKIIVFPENVILHSPITQWPQVNCLIAFHSKGFPLAKALAYVEHVRPFLINDLNYQWVLQDRMSVSEILGENGIDQPRWAVKLHNDGKIVKEEDDYIDIDGEIFQKPFVEKPVNAEDHNIHIYFPPTAGGGSQRLFRKIGSRSSVYTGENKIRRNGDYIYEEFMPTDGTDVKVYTVGPDYAHAEARKSPALDGKVERDANGKEVRYPVMLKANEKLIARKICLAFKQTVCGFDFLRSGGKSYVCDVNGFSFVKTSEKYYEDCAQILGTMIIQELAPTFKLPITIQRATDDAPIVPTTTGTMMELRCVIAVIRHGDRTPKQKMKMEVRHPLFFELCSKYDDGSKGQLKLKRPYQLQEVLDIARKLIQECDKANSDIVPGSNEPRTKLLQMKSVLEMYGHFSGINRKIQFKLNRKKKNKKGNNEDDYALLLILKWGGELTKAGRHQAEELGKCFQKMYPGGQNEGGAPETTVTSNVLHNRPDVGLLRLHSTYRHDLKIYAADEGRVQMTAAAFTKGLLALEGELAPILVQMVKSADTNGLLEDDTIAQDEINKVKDVLKTYFHDKNFTEEEIHELANDSSISVLNTCYFLKNPVKACQTVLEHLKAMVKLIQNHIANRSVYEKKLYHSESWELLLRRWSKLQKDFYREEKADFDISKIPDIYDGIKYDILHNQRILRYPKAAEFFTISKALADLVIPLEYGIAVDERLKIAQGIVAPLLRKIKIDLERTMREIDDDIGSKLNPQYLASKGIRTPSRHVRTRLYFTSESHVHSLLNVIRYGGLFGSNDGQGRRANAYVSAVSELNYLTQIVIMLHEDRTKSLDSEERFHVEIHFSPGVITGTQNQEMKRMDNEQIMAESNKNWVIHEERLQNLISASHQRMPSSKSDSIGRFEIESVNDLNQKSLKKSQSHHSQNSLNYQSDRPRKEMKEVRSLFRKRNDDNKHEMRKGMKKEKIINDEHQDRTSTGSTDDDTHYHTVHGWPLGQGQFVQAKDRINHLPMMGTLRKAADYDCGYNSDPPTTTRSNETITNETYSNMEQIRSLSYSDQIINSRYPTLNDKRYRHPSQMTTPSGKSRFFNGKRLVQSELKRRIDNRLTCGIFSTRVIKGRTASLDSCIDTESSYRKRDSVLDEFRSMNDKSRTNQPINGSDVERTISVSSIPPILKQIATATNVLEPTLIQPGAVEYSLALPLQYYMAREETVSEHSSRSTGCGSVGALPQSSKLYDLQQQNTQMSKNQDDAGKNLDEILKDNETKTNRYGSSKGKNSSKFRNRSAANWTGSDTAILRSRKMSSKYIRSKEKDGDSTIDAEPFIVPLETLHNKMSWKQMDNFLARMVHAASENSPSVSQKSSDYSHLERKFVESVYQSVLRTKSNQLRPKDLRRVKFNKSKENDVGVSVDDNRKDEEEKRGKLLKIPTVPDGVSSQSTIQDSREKFPPKVKGFTFDEVMEIRQKKQEKKEMTRQNEVNVVDMNDSNSIIAAIQPIWIAEEELEINIENGPSVTLVSDRIDSAQMAEENLDEEKESTSIEETTENYDSPSILTMETSENRPSTESAKEKIKSGKEKDVTRSRTSSCIDVVKKKKKKLRREPSVEEVVKTIQMEKDRKKVGRKNPIKLNSLDKGNFRSLSTGKLFDSTERLLAEPAGKKYLLTSISCDTFITNESSNVLTKLDLSDTHLPEVMHEVVYDRTSTVTGKSRRAIQQDNTAWTPFSRPKANKEQEANGSSTLGTSSDTNYLFVKTSSNFSSRSDTRKGNKLSPNETNGNPKVSQKQKKHLSDTSEQYLSKEHSSSSMICSDSSPQHGVLTHEKCYYYKKSSTNDTFQQQIQQYVNHILHAAHRRFTEQQNEENVEEEM